MFCKLLPVTGTKVKMYYVYPCKAFQLPCYKNMTSSTNTILHTTVDLVYSGHPSDAAKWLLYTGGLLIEVFNVYVVHGKFRWDFPY